MRGGQGARRDPGARQGGARRVGGREGTLLRAYFANKPWVGGGEQGEPVRVPLLKGCGTQATRTPEHVRGCRREPGKDA